MSLFLKFVNNTKAEQKNQEPSVLCELVRSERHRRNFSWFFG
ncbi:Uncharacterized protein dnm_027440 [Desulfonema magnum]|uniref:Uncharacterized protein n=1 Tax=Desulfonema magnum TaxID=45655 RepID=A0A975BJV1_9BACT|nr:Uncharacterized protein dnm_027440 [Desulfonema magnum]